jgi:hypothetical protein
MKIVRTKIEPDIKPDEFEHLTAWEKACKFAAILFVGALTYFFAIKLMFL